MNDEQNAKFIFNGLLIVFFPIWAPFWLIGWIGNEIYESIKRD